MVTNIIAQGVLPSTDYTGMCRFKGMVTNTIAQGVLLSTDYTGMYRPQGYGY